MIECKFTAIICPSPDRELDTSVHSPSENRPVIASIHTKVRGWVGVRSCLAGAFRLGGWNSAVDVGRVWRRGRGCPQNGV